MSKIKLYKEKFHFYWGQRKYKLSLWGVSPHFDWIITLVVTAILLVGSCIFGFVTYKMVDATIHAKLEPETYKNQRVNVGEMKKLIESFDRAPAEIQSTTE